MSDGTALEKFRQSARHKAMTALQQIPQDQREDVYALSFWFTRDDDDLRYPKIIISYNTFSHFQKSIEDASDEKEAKWNYAFWLQEDIDVIGGENDESLAAWLKGTPWYYTDEENEAAEEDDDELFDELMERGDAFNEAFINEIIALTKSLFDEGFISSQFGKNIPVLIHELEYYDKPLAWTRAANPTGLADEFIAAFK